MIYKVIYLIIVTLKVLPTSCFCYNSKENCTKFPIPRMKPNRVKDIMKGHFW